MHYKLKLYSRRFLAHIYTNLLINQDHILSLFGMAEFKHLVVVKFKEGVAVEDLIKGMEKMVSQIDTVKSFEWYVS